MGFNLHTSHHGHGFNLSQFSTSRPSSPAADIISAFKQVDEETLPKYNATSFYPMRLRETLNDRYQVIAKLGYGATSTVWLAKDLHASSGKSARKYVTVKVNVNTVSDEWIKTRVKVAQRIATANPKHPGFEHVRFILDSFKLKGPNGHHICVVYDVLREPIDLCMDKFSGHLFNSRNLRILLPAILQGLDYLHSECHVVHTDLKPENVMMGLGCDAVLEKFVKDANERPSPHKTPDSHGRIIYQSRSDFGDAPSDLVIASAKVTDLGLAVFGDEPNNHSIQANAFMAPEVILAAGWSYPADIWNLGVMLWDLFENFGLFDAINTNPAHYRPEQHLGLMIALMGPPPKKLLQRGSKTSTYFDEKGEFRYPKLASKTFTLESAISRIRGEEKDLFIDFAQKMICWLPEERWTAKQLLEHPWLKLMERSESPASLTSSKPAGGADRVSATITTSDIVATASATIDSIETTVSEAVAKADPNAASGELIRKILNRK